MQRYSKAIVAILGAAVTAALGIFPPNSTGWVILTIASAAITAATVYAVPNTDPATGANVDRTANQSAGGSF